MLERNRKTLATLFSVALGMLLSCLTSSAWAEPNSLTKQEKQAGWKLLFDGKTKEGWRNYKQDGINKGWKVIDGALTRVDPGAGDIITKDQYDSFELSLEYKISPEGNSGIMFHVSEQEARPWMTGPEIQIQDNVDGHDPQKSGWLYQLYKPDVDATKPAGEWNEVRLRITPERCEIYMNGVRYARFVKGSADWDMRVAKSKFGKMPNFGKPTKGYISLQDHGDEVAYRSIKVRKIVPGEAPTIAKETLPVKAVVAFGEMEWDGWSPENESGKVVPLRPIVLTNAGDGTGRIFVATQRGVVHAFKPGDKKTQVFLDIQDRVIYKDNQNEEGLLGLAFHPNYKENGQLFIYYSTKEAPQTSIISRFRVSKSDATKADADSEQELMRIEQPFWNHNGGTIAFGHDGHLYVGLGDGGAANDPHENAQNLGTLLGSILRIDVDNSDKGLPYAIPSDNPFANQKGKRGEIWAYGLRNVWRMSFDRENGTLWAADVGQNLWEEVNVIKKGGNYGWNLREAAHMFGAKGSGPKPELIDPVFEYEHEVGKSVTGGTVYRGSKVPALQGKYIFADYITGKLWALTYDAEKQTVVANHAISRGDKEPIISFGEDENGEVYFTVVTASGRGIYKFESAK